LSSKEKFEIRNSHGFANGTLSRTARCLAGFPRQGLLMLNLRNRLPDVEEAGGAVVDHVMKAANTAAQSAKGATVQLEEWAKDSVKTRPMIWGAASLGFGALMGGLYALWRKNAKPNGRISHRTMPVRSRAKQALRAITETAEAQAPKKRATQAKRPRPSAHD
jgi:hypothetical protein